MILQLVLSSMSEIEKYNTQLIHQQAKYQEIDKGFKLLRLGNLQAKILWTYVRVGKI